MRQGKRKKLRPKLTFEVLEQGEPQINSIYAAHLDVERSRLREFPSKLAQFIKLVGSNSEKAVQMVRDDPAEWLPVLQKLGLWRWALSQPKIGELLYLLFDHAQHGKGFLAHESFKLLSRLLPKRPVGGGSPHTSPAVILRAYKGRLREINKVIIPERRSEIRRRWRNYKTKTPDERERMRRIGQEYFDWLGVRIRFGDIRAALARSNDSYAMKWVANDLGVTKDYVEKIVHKSAKR